MTVTGALALLGLYAIVATIIVLALRSTDGR
jgi:hypothetical protein